MAQFLRGKQAGIQVDLSAGLAPELFAVDNVARYGINSRISAIAYDPVQSLLAVGTSESQFGSGQVYVFGQKRVCVALSLARQSSIKTLQFSADRLVSVDSKNDLTIFDLKAKKAEASYAPPGRISALFTDPTLDYAFIGLQNGDIIAYDMDRHGLAQLRIPCLLREFNPRARPMPVLAVVAHPRDVGTLLVAYGDGVAVYSFKQNKATCFLHYELQPGAPGGFPDPSSANRVRHPAVVHAAWHPTGTFILTAHDDESLVIWDPKTGKIIQARTLQDANVNQAGRAAGTSSSSGSTPGTFALRSPIFRIAWCSKQNPDDTGILVAGGTASNVPDRGITFLELGQTPIYQTSSWPVLSQHFEKPKRRYLLPTPPNTDVVDFVLIPRESPHYCGSHNPIAVIAVLASGELVTLSFPSGHSISPTNQLHASLTFVHPFVSKISLSFVERTRWLGMTERRSQGPPLLKGGAGATHPLMRFEDRNVIQTAHVDGTVRIWDVGHGDEIENEGMLQVDVARALARSDAMDISKMSMSGAAGELAIGMGTGEVVVFRWDRNKFFGQEVPSTKTQAFGLESIKERADPDLKEGLIPLTMFSQKRSPVTALRMSDIGFVAAGFEDGSIVVVDLRGPAVIYSADLAEFAKASKRTSIRKSGSSDARAKPEWPTIVEFAVMDLEGEDYSSILLFVGTNSGRFLTFKLLPNPQGGYSVQLAGSTSLDDWVVAISPLKADTGKPAFASQTAVGSLHEGYRVNGVVLVVTTTAARIFKPAAAKGASKAWNNFFCDAAAVVRRDDRSTALVALFGDGNAKTFTIPSLKEVASVKVDHILDVRRFSESIISGTGDIFGWTGPSEIAVINAWGSGIDATISRDKLINPDLMIPPRPTISNIQWISGTQYFTAADLDLLVGGPDRPPSKRMLEQMRSEDRQRQEAARSGAGPSFSAIDKQDEGYWAYMQRQVQERTERLNVMGDSMERLEESSAGWADDVSKYVRNQKRKAVMGVIGSKFGF